MVDGVLVGVGVTVGVAEGSWQPTTRRAWLPESDTKSVPSVPTVRWRGPLKPASAPGPSANARPGAPARVLTHPCKTMRTASLPVSPTNRAVVLGS